MLPCGPRSPSYRGSWRANGIDWPTAGAAYRAPANSIQAAPDDEWHEVRKRAKRARYATDAAAPAIGSAALDLGVALAAVTDALGAHQDAAIAADTWLGIALADPDNHSLAITAGRLIERERAAVIACRRDYPRRWADATQDRLTAWLR